MKKVYQGKKIKRNKSEIKKENFNTYIAADATNIFSFIDPLAFCYGFMTEDQVKNDFKKWKKRSLNETDNDL